LLIDEARRALSPVAWLDHGEAAAAGAGFTAVLFALLRALFAPRSQFASREAAGTQ